MAPLAEQILILIAPTDIKTISCQLLSAYLNEDCQVTIPCHILTKARDILYECKQFNDRSICTYLTKALDEV